MEIVTEMGQKFEGIGEGVYLVIPVCLLIKKKIKGSKEYRPQWLYEIIGSSLSKHKSIWEKNSAVYQMLPRVFFGHVTLQ